MNSNPDEMIDVRGEVPTMDIQPEDPRKKLEEDTKRVSRAFESMETIGDLIQVLMENPSYVFRVRYDQMDNKLVVRLGSTTGYYSEMKYNIGGNDDW